MRAFNKKHKPKHTQKINPIRKMKDVIKAFENNNLELFIVRRDCNDRNSIAYQYRGQCLPIYSIDTHNKLIKFSKYYAVRFKYVDIERTKWFLKGLIL